MSWRIWRKHIWKRVAREGVRVDKLPFELAVKVVKANRPWLEATGWRGAYKLWDKITDAESENCPERHWPYWFEDGNPDIYRTFAERYGHGRWKEVWTSKPFDELPDFFPDQSQELARQAFPIGD